MIMCDTEKVTLFLERRKDLNIEGYKFVLNFNAEDTLQFPETLPVDGIVVGNDAMWHYMTTGTIQQEGNANGRTTDNEHENSNQ